MKYSTKSAQYYKYFEDAKIIEMDNDNKKLALVLNGKDDVIDIFDSAPYVNYNPFEYISKSDNIEQSGNQKRSYGIVQIEDQPNFLNVNQIFKEIKNYKNNTEQTNQTFSFAGSIQNNSTAYSNSKNQLIEGQNLFLYDKYVQRPKKEKTTFSRILSNINKENKEIIGNSKINSSISDDNKAIKYENLYITKFQIYYLSSMNNYKKIKLNLKKPKIQHRLLSVIQLTHDTVLGMKWFMFNSKDNKKIPRNLSQKEKYILNSKLMLVVSQEGCVSVYQLINYEPFQPTRVNIKLPALQSQPFSNFKERYNIAASVKLSNPVLDYNLLNKPLENDNQSVIRLITLHINNSFTFWYIIKQGEKIELTIQYNFQLSNFRCENFLMDSHEEYLICFNKKGIIILLSKGQNFPYPIVYRYTFNDILPPLEELKKIIYTNDVINDEETKDEKNEEEKKDLEIIEKPINNKNKKEKEKKDEKETKTKKKRGRPKKEDKDKKEQKKKENAKKDKKQKDKIEDTTEDSVYNLFRIKEYNGEEDEDEEDEIDEDDDFVVEGNPNFINRDIDIFFEDDKFLKFLQKPCFLSSETKFLFVNYEVKSNQYSLYCFDFSGLYQIEEDEKFLERCLNKYDDNLITKIYSSKEKIYIHESPFYYFNPLKDDSIDNDLLNNINNRKLLQEKKFEFKTILANLYHGLFIRDGDYIIIIKLNINDNPDLELINNDIKLTKFLFYDQPTSENLKSNRLAVWTVNNTLIVNSVDNLFSIIKFRNEANILGIAISKKKVVEYTKMSFNN